MATTVDDKARGTKAPDPATAGRPRSFVQDGPRALLCVDASDRQAAVTIALHELGYTADAATSVDEATERLRKNSYDLIVLDEEFQGSTEHDNAVLASIHAMPMSTRRYIFVTLIGTRFGTLDNMMAFVKSVNLVVHVSDVSQLTAILSRAVEDNDRFYRVYREVLKEAGKR
jgi:DNA-binding NtrC family response regulator